MKLPNSVSKILTNRYVLYLVTILALFNVLGYIMMDNTHMVVLFVLVGYLTTHFSKNMSIVLLVPLVLVNLINSGIAIKEGAENMGDSPPTSEPAPPVPPTPTSAPMSPPPTPSGPPPTPSGPPTTDEPVPAMKDPFQVGQAGAGQPARVDYGTTLEKAYDDLNNVLGSDGIKSLTNDTQKLMNQQLQLAESMKGMEPLMKQAQGMLKNLNIDGLGDLPALIKKFGINAPAA
jgi:hypothetical protein